MKRISGIIALAAMMLTLTACGSGRVVYERQTDKTAATGRSWTVLVYMCGGSGETLNGSSSEKLDDMMKVEYPENISVVVQTGGSVEWHTKGVYSDYLQRFEVGNGTMYLADQAVAANMGDYRTLADFLMWGISNYESDSYMLILSGAGGGSICGMAYDELNDDDSLTLEEISYALSLAGKNFDIIGLDAPLMGSLETASALSTSADYLVCSQDIQGADSWDYAGFLQAMCESPSAGADEIGKAVCRTYYDKCVQNGTAADAAMSVVDMSKISTLTQAFDGMAGEMLTATDSLDTYANLSNAINSVHIYGGATDEEGYSNSIDLGDAAVKIGGYVGNTADVLIEALNDAVVYRVCGERQMNSSGLSVYYPICADSEELQEYMDIVTSVKYKEYLRKICIDCVFESDTADYTSSWAWTNYANDMQWLEYQTVLDGNSYEIYLTGNMCMIRDVSINVYKADEQSGKYVFIGKYYDVDSQWEAGIFKDGFDGRMLSLAGKSVSARLVRRYDDYEIYSVPVILNGERSNIRIEHDRAADTYEIIGAWAGLDERGKAASSIEAVGFFDRITPILAVYDEEHKQTEYITGDAGMRLFGGAEESKIENGEYILEYEITDIYGLKRRGTPVKCAASGGEFRFE
ncbi:MAG: clostripain-related cysteine peptidase [Firmicutes bacterium]|nr:clostripain-related cysteine peptidase [Bacillota bacterium]